jgi:hypothetical protein
MNGAPLAQLEQSRSAMQAYSSSWLATGNAPIGVFSRDDDLIQREWCSKPVNVLRRYRWVGYGEHQMSRGFIRKHHLGNFRTRQHVDTTRLPLGVISSQYDNHIFWKNVARTELLLMGLAGQHLSQIGQVPTTQKVSNLRDNQAWHYRNFRQAQLYCRIQEGYFDFTNHPEWRYFKQSLPSSVAAPDAVKLRYLSRRISLFDNRSDHGFHYLFPSLPPAESIADMERYLALVMSEHVIAQAATGNYLPAIEYRRCFPVASRTIHLRTMNAL